MHESLAAHLDAAPARKNPLTAQHRLLAEYIIYGVSHESLCRRTKVVDHYDAETGQPVFRYPRVGEPLDPINAGEVLNMRRRHVRMVQQQPHFERLLAAETAAFRNGARARATRRMVDLIDEPGQGKAADRKVQLSAAQAVLGEGDGNRSGPTVNVYGGSGGQLVAGIVIVRRNREQPEQSTAPTIEHEDKP